MSYFDDPKNVETYVRMAEGYDGRTLIKRFADYVRPGATVLELGMGPGTDIDLLSESYLATGSDSSAAFLDRYRKTHPQADLLQLDVLTLDTERTFDAIFSNKVLQHIPRARLQESLERQLDLLNPGGIAFHTLWRGEGEESFEGLLFVQYEIENLRAAVPDGFMVLEASHYQEDKPDDSILIVLQRRS